jgi:hypothetical protein
VFDPAWLMVPAYGEFLRRRPSCSRAWRFRPLAFHRPPQAGHAGTGAPGRRAAHRRFLQRGGAPPAGAPVLAPGPQQRLPRNCAPGSPWWPPTWTPAKPPLRRPGLGPRADLARGAGLLGPARPVPAGGDRRPHFVDGALKKTLHASVALDEGVDLLLCLNPLVPFKVPRIAEGGLPAVLGQTFRSLIHSRLELGMKHYERAYPDTDIVLLEPDRATPSSPRQHVQLPAPARTRRTRLPADPRVPAAPAQARWRPRSRATASRCAPTCCATSAATWCAPIAPTAWARPDGRPGDAWTTSTGGAAQPARA